MAYFLRQILGILLLVVPFALFTLLVATWPATRNGTGNDVVVSGLSGDVNEYLGGNPEVRLLVIVMLAGAVGSAIHAAKVFATRIGLNNFEASWLWWYLLRFPTGVGMALLVYLVIRGGLFAGSFADREAAVNAVNPFGLAALAALTGMFSRQATDKLEEIFEGIFRTADDGARQSSPPVVQSVGAVKKGAVGAALKTLIKGGNFAHGVTATVADKDRLVRRVSATELQITLLPEDVVAAGKLKLVVSNPAGAGGGKAATEITVDP